MLDAIDWDQVETSYQYLNLDQPSQELVAEMVVRAASTFLPQDQDKTLIATELPFQFDITGEVRAGTIDLVLKQDEQVIVVDWKTTRKPDYRWAWREEHSPQIPEYVQGLVVGYHVALPVVYEVRGVSREKDETNTVKKIVTEDDLRIYSEELNTLRMEREALINKLGWHQQWPRSKPFACEPFGPKYRCRFWDICKKGYNVSLPEGLAPRPEIHQSTEKDYMRCRERFRLLTWEREGVTISKRMDDPDQTALADLGTAFHLGIAEVYQQVLGDQREEN